MKILFVDPYANTFFSFRYQLFQRLALEGNEMILVSEDSPRFSELRKKYKIVFANCQLRNKTIFSNLSLISEYRKIVKETKPDLILTFTIKPNLYCNPRSKETLKISTITGLGSAFSARWPLKQIVVGLSKHNYKKSDAIVFQNTHDRDVFEKCKIPLRHMLVVPGSGVDLSLFPFSPINDHSPFVFTYISRIIKEKGIGDFLSSVEALAPTGKFAFRIYGSIVDTQFSERIQKLEKAGFVTYSTFVENPQLVYKESDFIVLPSYYNEGISNVLLEACASGRPIITCMSTPGCGAVLVDGKNGFSVEPRNPENLTQTIQKAANLSQTSREEMGKFARQYVGENFSRQTVIQDYLSLIKSLQTSKQ